LDLDFDSCFCAGKGACLQICTFRSRSAGPAVPVHPTLRGGFRMIVSVPEFGENPAKAAKIIPPHRKRPATS